MGLVDDPDVSVSAIERVAVGVHWAKETWAPCLAPYLAGEMQLASIALTNEQMRDSELIKAAILDWVGLSAEKYRQKFLTARWIGGVWP